MPFPPLSNETKRIKTYKNIQIDNNLMNRFDTRFTQLMTDLRKPFCVHIAACHLLNKLMVVTPPYFGPLNKQKAICQSLRY